ncbi:zinc finger protein with KRAB and SCAN domains 8-like [Cimex lectularius]|uniref:C2H2-type domain-containing protein n=1 Tax=Cimex lectularius TaxID=79782 RepID=A0A8I6S2Q5_CIMLE|nr:zinc finger protein with KRAB and SCAN domains 8-like [Cimex lectularius]
MLASQFLNVIIEEKTENKVQGNEDRPKNDDDDDDANNNILSNFSFKTNLPSVLLSECTIELCSQAEKKKIPELRFEASLSPSKKPRFNHLDVDILPYTVKEANSKEDNNIEELLQGVEAVYSDDEDSNEEDEDSNSGSSEGSRCPYCGRVFYRNCSLALHLKWHCSKAPKPHLAQPEVTLQLHPKNTAANDVAASVAPAQIRAYKCEVCGKSYAHKSVLKKHSVVHTGERLKCSLCSIEFTQRSSLLRHCKRIHKMGTEQTDV